MKRQWAFLKNYARQMNDLQHLREKLIAEVNVTALKAWEEKLGKEFLWEIRPFKSACVYWRN